MCKCRGCLTQRALNILNDSYYLAYCGNSRHNYEYQERSKRLIERLKRERTIKDTYGNIIGVMA